MRTSRLKIRGAKSDDYKEILEIFKSHETDGEENWDLESARKYYDNFFGDKSISKDKVFIGIIDDKIAAVIGYSQNPLNQGKGTYRLNWFYVHKNYEGDGLGTQLLRNVVQRLKDNNARKLFVNTSSNQFYKSAINLYQKVGFIQEAVLRDYYDDGEDQLIFALILSNKSRQRDKEKSGNTDYEDKIKKAVDVVELINQYVLLRKTGRNYVGLCPFHIDKDPSFIVNPERQSFHCFGCKKGGDVFEFWMEYHSTTFPEAIMDLAEQYDITT